jgi:thymidine phosphorylase
MAAYLPQEIIRKKRDGLGLDAAEIAFLIEGLDNRAVSEAQLAAFAMAVFFNGLNLPERVALTRAMTHSGRVLDWNLPGPVLDKHSTGGIGDTVSLMLAPAVAACGGYVPMISGRGLGHTGGTLDKLDSIPGYASQPDEALFRKVTAEVGCAIIGQTSDLAPADKVFYAVRDVTATVESVALITASILSKKLAAGLQGLAMDVKFGSGAFMPSYEAARDLALSLATVATGAGLPTTALLTDMNEPLAPVAGNALEVRHAIDYLTGRERNLRLHGVTVALGAEMLVLGGLATDPAEGARHIEAAIASGKAAEIFARMVAALGGPSDLMEAPDRHLASAEVTLDVHASTPGIVCTIDTRAIGLAVVRLGGGRTRSGDPIDHAVGISGLAGIGDDAGVRPLGTVHARSMDAAQTAAAALRAAYGLGEAAQRGTLIMERIAGSAG